MPTGRPMALFDRLLPPWRHSDPEIRAAAVRSLGQDEAAIVASLARKDPDARVRREAVRRTEDPELLVEVSAADTDDEVRSLAAARAGDLFIERAVAPNSPAQGLDALARLDRPSQILAVAARAAVAEVRQAALARLSDEGSLAEVARRCPSADTAMEALAGVHSGSLLRRIAATAARAEVALAALERIEDGERLHGLAFDRQANKAVRKRARLRIEELGQSAASVRTADLHAQRLDLISEAEALAEATDPDEAARTLRTLEARWHDLAARAAADAGEDDLFRSACATAVARIEWAARRSASQSQSERAHQQERQQREELCAALDATSGAEAPSRITSLREAWQALGPIRDAHDDDLAARFATALERCEQRHAKWQARHDFHERLERLVRDAEALVAGADRRDARQRRQRLEQAWGRLAQSPAGTKWMTEERELERRFRAAGEEQLRHAEAFDAKRRQRENEARQRLVAVCERLEKLTAEAAVKTTAVDAALAAATQATETLRRLPPAERNELRKRLEDARDALVRHTSEQTAAEEWKRWANADAQRRLIEQAEALLASGDPKRMLDEVVALDRDWKRFASAPPPQARKLWERFRTARNEIRQRTHAYLADNLAQKTALCEAAERLGDSTDWDASAAAFRRLQAEWKAIGPVPARLAHALFERFRAPANAFFERRAGVKQERRERFEERLAALTQLRDEALPWAESTDWNAAAAEIKRLQAAWSEAAPRGPLRNPDSPLHAVAESFRAACDRFYQRFRQRDAIEAEARVGGATAVVEELEALQAQLAAGAVEPQSAVERLAASLAAWRRRGPLPADAAVALATRVQLACDAIEHACPADVEELGLDIAADVQQREKLCGRLDRLVAEFAQQAEAPATEDLGERLRLAMAANTIGGSSAPPREHAMRETLHAAQRLHDKWARLAPLVGGRARTAEARFQAAWSRLDELSRQAGLGAPVRAETPA